MNDPTPLPVDHSSVPPQPPAQLADEEAHRRATTARNIDALGAMLVLLGSLGTLTVLVALYTRTDALFQGVALSILLPIGLGLSNREPWACFVASGLAVVLALAVVAALPVGLFGGDSGPEVPSLLVAFALSAVFVHRLLRLLHRASAIGLFPSSDRRSA